MNGKGHELRAAAIAARMRDEVRDAGRSEMPADAPYLPSPYVERGALLGELVEAKQRQYGDSAGRAGGIMRILYPAGVAPHQMDDALLVVRVLDKLSRIAQRGVDGRDLGGESPWKDVAGYGLLGWRKDEP